ncbi:hypothetical protein PFISCL1PPCAC_17857, partial [Pristionchus fissidentatus]
FFSSGRPEEDLFHFMSAITVFIALFQHLLSLFSRHFRNLIYYGNYSRDYQLSGKLKSAFEDWYETCYRFRSDWLKFSTYESLDAMLKFAKDVETEQVVFDRFEQHLCECCQFQDDIARDIIINN